MEESLKIHVAVATEIEESLGSVTIAPVEISAVEKLVVVFGYDAV